MADDPNIERVRRARERQKGRRKVGRKALKALKALKPTRPNLGRRVGPPDSRPVGGRRVGPPKGAPRPTEGRRALQPMPTDQRDLRVRVAAKVGSGTRSVPRPPGIAKVAQARRLPPGHAKKAAGVQSARTFAPGALAKRMSSGTPRTGKPSRSQVRGLVPEPTSLIERIKAQGGKRGSGAPPRRSGKPSRSQFDRMVGR